MQTDGGLLSNIIKDTGYLQNLGPVYHSYAGSLDLLQERLSEGRFHLAVLGQFKRGKSTLLNALLGDQILPSSVIPLTAVPTLIQYSDKKEVRVRFLGGREDNIFQSDDPAMIRQYVETYVSEEINPHNKLQVLQVEILWPSPLLAKGVILIDTPGIGSTHQHNTEMTITFLSECDAALFLISSDPPMTDTELAFLKQIKAAVPKIFFLLNKIDYLSEEEKVVAAEFFRQTLIEKGEYIDPLIFLVSAKWGLSAALIDDPNLWYQSGLSALSDHLFSFLTQEKTDVLHTAIRQRAAALMQEVSMHLALEIRSLELPMSDLEVKQELFKGKINEAMLQQRRSQDVLAGDHKRVIDWLEEWARDLIKKAEKDFMERSIILLEANGYNPAPVHDIIAEELPDYFEPELRALTSVYEKKVSLLLSEHQQQADVLIRSIISAAADLFAIPLHEIGEKKVWVLDHEPYWVSRTGWQTLVGSLTDGVFGKFLPLSLRKKGIIEDMRSNINRLVLHNTENIRWATMLNINKTFSRFTCEFNADMNRIIEATGGAVDATVEFRARHAEKTGERLSQVKHELNLVEERIEYYRGGCNAGVPLVWDRSVWIFKVHP
jgi:small GTP-binding protein